MSLGNLHPGRTANYRIGHTLQYRHERSSGEVSKKSLTRSVLHLGQRIGEVDPIAVPTMLVTRIRQPLGQAHEDSCQVLRKDLGVEILQ